MSDNVYTALAKAQTKMGKAVKSSENPHFRSSYADLAAVMHACLPALSEAGLAIWHSMSDGLMRTTISHGASDTHIHCDVPLIVDKNNMQGMKSATTYAKRIGVESVTGIAPEDDDGNEASKAAPPKAKQESKPLPPVKPKQETKPLPPPKPIAPPPPDENKIARSMALMEEAKGLGWRPKDVVDLVKKNFGVDKASLLSEEQFANLRELLITQEPPEVPSEI